MTPPDDARPSLGDTLFRLAQDITKLDPGPLARLRRMGCYGPGEGDFWVLAMRHGLRTDAPGMRLIQFLAMLTPKGAPHLPKKLHDAKRSLGTALVEANYPESRLLRFLALPFETRGDAMEGMVRWLAAKGHEGINIVDIALLLFSPDVRHARRLAQTYYAAHHKAADTTAKKDAAA